MGGSVTGAFGGTSTSAGTAGDSGQAGASQGDSSAGAGGQGGGGNGNGGAAGTSAGQASGGSGGGGGGSAGGGSAGGSSAGGGSGGGSSGGGSQGGSGQGGSGPHCLDGWRDNDACDTCSTQTQGDKKACASVLDCYIANDCGPATCSGNTDVCGANAIQQGTAPFPIAEDVYDCICQ
jgi:hypothetical protein